MALRANYRYNKIPPARPLPRRSDGRKFRADDELDRAATAGGLDVRLDADVLE